MENLMNNEKNIFLEKFFLIQNLHKEEQNYIEILKGYCENEMENSDELSKIYPLLNTIYTLHLKAAEKSNKLVSGK